ncbi:MAG: ElyC/SanA/YdcF family protein [Leptolyngbyaceae cyanobacterium bins.59]|nr:ElyC/SanA/YdcF family protein [Leptolyngbyaceae cyanobacterium bins.59]
MFDLLSKVLLALLLVGIAWYAIRRFVSPLFYTIIGFLALLAFIVLAIVSPTTDGAVADVWQILSLPLKPLGLALVLLMSALLQGLPIVRQRGFVKDGKFVGWKVVLTDAIPQVVIATLVLLIFSLPVVAQELVERLERQGLNAPATQDLVVSTIVLLGRDATKPTTLPREAPNNLQLQLTDNRVAYTAELYAQQRERGSNPQIIVCASPKEGGRIEADDIGILLSRFGVPITNVVSGRTTFVTTSTDRDANPRRETRRDPECNGVSILSSAESVQRILRERDLSNQIILVNPAISMYRAVTAFNRKGINVVPRPTDFQALGVLPARTFRRILPSAEALALSTRATDEWLASLYYYLRDR